MELHGGDTSNDQRYWHAGMSQSKEGTIPTRKDVLLGRGRTHEDNPGNVLFHQAVDEFLSFYNDFERGTKGYVIERTIELIRRRGGRFLKKQLDGIWIEVPEQVAMAKVGQAFRHRRRMLHRSGSTSSSHSTEGEAALPVIMEPNSVSVSDFYRKSSDRQLLLTYMQYPATTGFTMKEIGSAEKSSRLSWPPQNSEEPILETPTNFAPEPKTTEILKRSDQAIANFDFMAYPRGTVDEINSVDFQELSGSIFDDDIQVSPSSAQPPLLSDAEILGALGESACLKRSG